MKSPSKFTKRPVTVEAFNPASAVANTTPEWFRAAVAAGVIEVDPITGAGVIHCHRHGDLTVNRGDWVIRGVEGELYPCDPDVFAKTYDVAKEPSAGHVTRMAVELEQLTDRLSKGYAFTGTEQFRELPSEDRALLMTQLHHMGHYQAALIQRLHRAEHHS